MIEKDERLIGAKQADGKTSADDATAQSIEQTAEQSVAIIDEQSIRDKIYTVRGVQVMLDFELAEVYGYTTKRFNEQVKNNIEKFDEDFRFQLSSEETKILRSKKSTSSWGGSRYRPWAFTESGIYMLMTVLRGDLATRQSKALIRTFRAMKDYIFQGRALITQQDYLRLSMQMTDTQQELHLLQEKVNENTEQISKIMVNLDDTVRSSDLPTAIKLMQRGRQRKCTFPL